MAKKIGSNSPAFMQLSNDDHHEEHHEEEHHEEHHEEEHHDDGDGHEDDKKPETAQSKIDNLKNKVLPTPTAAPKAVREMLNKAGAGTPAPDAAKSDSVQNGAADAAKAALKASAAGAAAGTPAQKPTDNKPADNKPADNKPAQKPAQPAQPAASTTAPANTGAQNVPVCAGAAKAAQDTTQAKGQNMTMLVPVKKEADAVDVNKLGATDKMSVKNEDFKKAEKVIKKVGDRHEAFVNKHEKDCKGSICPLEGKKDKK
jgi:hypothetical protein